MNEHDPIIESLEQIGNSLRREPSMKESIMRQMAARNAASIQSRRPWYVRRTLGAIGALAACVAMAVMIWSLGGGFDAQKAFAGAIDRVKFARTFTCTQSYESSANGQGETKHVTRFMFKEPDLERYEHLGTHNGDEITIDDYRARRSLTLKPISKEASLADTSTMYTVQPVSGRLRPTRLNTGLREQILGWSTRTAQDLGLVTLEGRSARLLRSAKGKAIIHVWLDPQTRLPMQITLENSVQGWRWLYTGITIDEPLDDSLFSTVPPADYKLFREGMYTPWPDHIGQVYAKMRFLSTNAWEYAGKHGDQFPKDLSELAGVGVSEEVIKTVLAPEGRPDASPIIAYRQPRPDRDTGKEIMFYEVFDQWPAGGIAVGMVDGHCEVIEKQSRFDELMK